MTTNRLMRLVACATAALLVAACASTPLEEQPAAPVSDASGGAAGAKPGAGTADPRAWRRSTPGSSRGMDPLNDPASPLSKRSIYFDFDSFVVKPEYQGTVEAHGKFLVANPSRRVTIEGMPTTAAAASTTWRSARSAPSREEPAAPARRGGVADGDGQLGEEKPASTGVDEAAWSQNRRADLNYK